MKYWLLVILVLSYWNLNENHKSELKENVIVKDTIKIDSTKKDSSLIDTSEYPDKIPPNGIK